MFKSTKKVRRCQLQTLLDENSARIFEELAKPLNVGKSTFLIVYTQWERRQISSTWIVWTDYSNHLNFRLHFIVFSSPKEIVMAMKNGFTYNSKRKKSWVDPG